MALGYARTTTLEVQRRAGVSRGALLHHFPAKAELMVGTVRHLALLRGRELRDGAARLPDGEARSGAVFDMLWESFTGPLFTVAWELRTAARTDAELRCVLAQVERELHGHILAQCRELFGEPVASKSGFAFAIDATLQLMIGAATSQTLHRDPERVGGLIDHWKTLFPQLLESTDEQ